MNLFQFASNWRELLGRRVDARMQETLQVGLETARDLVHVQTGYLRSTIGGEYRQSDRTILLHADAPYALAEETRGPTARYSQHHYLAPAAQAMAAMWGGSFELHFPHATPGRIGPKEDRLYRRLGTGRRGVARRVRIISRRWHHWATGPVPFEITPIL